jgi:branched-chain amino acid transport system permease protein
MDNLLILYAAPIFSLQLLIDGLLIGAIFALAAYGMALVWGVMKIINFAQGEFVILGGFIVYALHKIGLNPFLCVPLAAAALYIVGWALYSIVIVRIVEKDLFISILATFGMAILLQQLMNQFFGADVQTVDPGLGTWYLFDDNVTVLQVKVVSFFIAVVLGICLGIFLGRYQQGLCHHFWPECGHLRRSRRLGGDDLGDSTLRRARLHAPFFHDRHCCRDRKCGWCRFCGFGSWRCRKFCWVPFRG